MRLSPLISLSLLLLAGQSARAQFLTADDFFNSGAQFYISNNIPAAKERVQMGRQIYPNDAKLEKLEQLLKQQQQSQSSQSQQNQQNQQQQQSQEQQNQQDKQNQQQQGGQSQEEKEKAEKAEQAKKDEEQKKEEEKQAQAAEQKKDEDKTGTETNEVTDAKGAHPMTPQEAEHLLNSQKDSEQYLSFKPKDKPENPNRVIKDW